MSIKVDGNYAYNGYSVIKEQQKASKEEAASSAARTEEAAAVSDKDAKNQDSYVKSTEEKELRTDVYRPSAENVSAARMNLSRNVDAFRAMSAALFKNQADAGSSSALRDILKNTESSSESGAVSFEDDPTWGVDAVAERILDFAKNLAGGDAGKIDLLRKAVEDGFKAAEKAWGGELPSISQKTYDKIMQGFDEWENPEAAKAEDDE